MIELEGVGYGYGGEALLRGLDLLLAPGSFHFLTGPSGSGKTTFLRLLARQIVPMEGRLSLFGEDAAGMTRDQVALVRRRVGMVHQDLAFLDHLPVAENVALPLTVAGREDAEAVRELLAWTGLTPRAGSHPPELSGGERQRLALARAVVMSPDVVLADEPTGNVDWEMSMRLMTLLVELNRMGKTILIATHDLGLIRAMKGRVEARTLRIRERGLELAGAEL